MGRRRWRWQLTKLITLVRIKSSFNIFFDFKIKIFTSFLKFGPKELQIRVQIQMDLKWPPPLCVTSFSAEEPHSCLNSSRQQFMYGCLKDGRMNSNVTTQPKLTTKNKDLHQRQLCFPCSCVRLAGCGCQLCPSWWILCTVFFSQWK